jgi:hypothetical protein
MALCSAHARWKCLAGICALMGVFCHSTMGHAAAKKRVAPDYDGRGTESAAASDAALWTARVIFFPMYVVSEYVIRRPLGKGIASAERAHLPETIYDFFMLTPDRKMGWVPTFFVDFGFKPSVGIYYFWNDAFTKGNDLRVHAATWGTDWLAVSIIDRIHLAPTRSLTLQTTGIRRPDYRFYGEGPSAPEQNRSRYGADRAEVSGVYTLGLGGMSQLEAGCGLRHVRFHQPDSDHVSVSTRAAEGTFALPAAFDTGYDAGFSRARLRVDSRVAQASASQSGVRLDLDAEQGSSSGANPRGWLRYGAIAGGFLDLNDRSRVVGLSVAAEFSDPLTTNAVPFTELVQLGGSELMRGFLPGRLFGRSALASTLSYRWPVWVWLDGTIQLAVGNVYGPHLEGMRPGLLRLSTAIGLQTAGASDNPVQLLVGFGTETFDRGAQINTLRVALGTSRGF